MRTSRESSTIIIVSHLFSTSTSSQFSRSPKNMPRVNSNANNATNAPDFLPSYEAVVGILDSSRLPSYKRSYAARFHPYRRPTFQTVDEGNQFLVSMTFFTYLFSTDPPPQRTQFLTTSMFHWMCQRWPRRPQPVSHFICIPTGLDR